MAWLSLPSSILLYLPIACTRLIASDLAKSSNFGPILSLWPLLEVLITIWQNIEPTLDNF